MPAQTSSPVLNPCTSRSGAIQITSGTAELAPLRSGAVVGVHLALHRHRNYLERLQFGNSPPPPPRQANLIVTPTGLPQSRTFSRTCHQRTVFPYGWKRTF